MYDPRLIGIWKSDKRKTSLEISARRDLATAKGKKLVALFGKLVIRYTRGKCYSQMEDYSSVSSYRVVAKDAHSVAIVSKNAISDSEVVHIHFEGEYYWICLGRFREYFKRIKKSSRPRELQGQKTKVLS